MLKSEYSDQLELLMTRSPYHPLIQTLLTGHSLANVMYLRHAIKNLPEIEEEPAVEATGLDIQKLYFTKSRLFGQRASLSNTMCDLPEEAAHDRERARYSDLIGDVQREIEKVMLDIDVLERGEKLPNPQDPSTTLPRDKAGLITKRQTIRSALSRARSKGNTANIKHYENQLANVEVALKNH